MARTEDIIITMIMVRLTNDISTFLVHRLPFLLDNGSAVLNKDPLDVIESIKGPLVIETGPLPVIIMRYSLIGPKRLTCMPKKILSRVENTKVETCAETTK